MMPSPTSSRIAATLLSLYASILSVGAADASRIGIYHWGGQYSHSMSEGVEAIAELGGHVARVVLSARHNSDYNISPDCADGFTLAAGAQDPDVKGALDNPAIDVFILTAYDGIALGDCQAQNFRDPAFFTPERTAAIAQEYNDLTLYLYRAYRDTQKIFLISNWESDNSVYCDHAFQYATDAGFRDTCRAQYAAAGMASPEDGLQGLKLWLDARAQGIAGGRSRAQAEGIAGNRVWAVPEFDIVHALHDNGFPSVLYDVLPFVTFDAVSYSAWESINNADPATTLAADLDTIRSAIGSSEIVIGEFGFLRQPDGAELQRTSDVISAALGWGVRYIVQWQLYDTDAMNAYGLYDLEGRPTPLAEWFRIRFGQDAP